MNLEYYDLGIEYRDETDDQVTIDAAHAIQKHGVGVKCATITPDEARVEEFGLKKMWRSPNGTIRNILGGPRSSAHRSSSPTFRDSFRAGPSRSSSGRHAFGDQYRATDFKVPGPGKVMITYTPEDGSAPIEHELVNFPEEAASSRGSTTSPRPSVTSLARRSPTDCSRTTRCTCPPRTPFSRRTTGAFKDIFQHVYETEFKAEFDAAGLTYEHRLIDDMVASALKWEGGYVWACKNYDGDVQSDTVAQGFGSLGLMTSVSADTGRKDL